MCRFALYLGDQITISSLVTEPANSIIHQSFHSHERVEPLNGDGFGIAWYVSSHPQPAMFKEITPAWNSLNLQHLARVTTTSCLLAHVRAASPGLPVTQLNCHPFVRDHLSFMHNGTVGGFASIKRALRAKLTQATYDAIIGSTDSEHVFALLCDEYASKPGRTELERISAAMERAIETTEALRKKHGVSESSLLNLCVADGERAVVSRFISDPDEASNSLYFHRGKRYECIDGLCRMVTDESAGHAVIVASEPLSDDPGWQPIPVNHLVLIDSSFEVEVRPMRGSQQTNRF